jgi:predicted exporter
MNTYGRVLPNTGLAVTVLGVTFGGATLLAIALALVLCGAVLVRVGWRRGLSVADR